MVWFLRGLNKLLLWYIGFLVLYGSLTRTIQGHNKWYLEELVPKRVAESLSSVTLVVAHPDDEVMFFSPTLAQFNEYLPLNVPVNVVCMTSGDADGLGHIRRQELVKSLEVLFHGREFSSHVFDFEDGMEVSWDSGKVSEELAGYIKDSNPLLVSFDEFGVSGHVNHISCAKAVQDMPHKHKLFLRSDQPIYVKYSAFVTGLFKLLMNKYKQDYERPRFFMSTLPQYFLSVSAMSMGHASQMVWFRVGWWLFSRFCFINELVGSLN